MQAYKELVPASEVAPANSETRAAVHKAQEEAGVQKPMEMSNVCKNDAEAGIRKSMEMADVCKNDIAAKKDGEGTPTGEVCEGERKFEHEMAVLLEMGFDIKLIDQLQEALIVNG